jgi:hypothetical protein
MILMNKYRSAFDKIKVTPEMEKRITHNLENAYGNKKKTFFQTPVKHIYTLAACFVLVFAATVSYFLFFDKDTDPNIGVTNPFEYYGNIGELKGALPFEFKTPGKIPPEYKIEGISVIAGKTAQIIYSDGTDTVTFRAASGNEDISGDYSEYSVILTEKVSDTEVTFKGNDEMIFLAVWQDDSCSYSLSFSGGTSLEIITEIIQSLGT